MSNEARQRGHSVDQLQLLQETMTSTEPGWRNWQTQRTQNPPIARSWGFDPPSRHQDNPNKINR
jgi:hypothetical protein